MEKYSSILNKIFITLVIIAVISGLNLLAATISLSNSTDNKNSETTKEESGSNSNYDVSMFESVSISGALALFDSKETSVLYLGRSTCGACVSFLPTLKTLQSELGYTTKYLDIETVNSSDENFSKFLAKLDTSITENINGAEKTGKISEFYGYTPMVVIIKNGKAVDASVGAYSVDSFRAFLNSNGIK